MYNNKGTGVNGKMERMLIEDVHAAVEDMVGLIRTYRSKRRISKVIVSTMFKRRMEETEATIDRAISDLKVSSSTKVIIPSRGNCLFYAGSRLTVELARPVDKASYIVVFGRIAE